MRIITLEMFFVGFAFLGFTWIPSIYAAVPEQNTKLVKKRFSCPFICLKFSKSNSQGVLYEGHEKFELYIAGNKYEDDFESRVLSKANLSCKGQGTAKLVDFNSQQYVLMDDMGNRKPLTKVTTVKVFSPATHCHEDIKKIKSK